MATSNSGLLVSFSPGDHDELIRQDEEGDYKLFSDTLVKRDWAIPRTSVALLSFSPSTLDYISIAKKGIKTVTAKFRVEFYELVNLQSFRIQELGAELSQETLLHLQKTSQGSGELIPENTWRQIIAAIKKQRSEVAKDIDRVISLGHYSGYRLTGSIADILLQEREALGIALDIFSGDNKLRDKVLRSWAPDSESVRNADQGELTAELVSAPGASFMSGIPQRYLQEESAIQHDLFNWNGLAAIHSAGKSIFVQGGRRLEVIYANKNALERTLGVDLIYYNGKYDSFVLVQYKLMRKDRETMLYRPDPQLMKELDRMDSICKPSEVISAIQSHQELRLNHDGFMFKLVPNYGLHPASGELIKGMYLLREYMRFLIGQKGPGSGAGPIITFEKAPRYLTNSEFCNGVNAGWLGTSALTA